MNLTIGYDSARRRPRHALLGDQGREQAVALVAAWLAFMAGVLTGGEVNNGMSFVLAGAIGSALVLVGFAAAWRSRTPVPNARLQPARFALLSLALGLALGALNLGANRAIAEFDPAVRALLIERMAGLRPVIGIVAAPLVEEVAVRLFLMSVLAWIVVRFTKRATLAFAVALLASSLFFAILHLDRPLPADPALANFYRAVLLVKYTLAGLPLGWIFWRWGLPYSILCHVAANAIHLVLQSVVF